MAAGPIDILSILDENRVLMPIRQQSVQFADTVVIQSQLMVAANPQDRHRDALVILVAADSIVAVVLLLGHPNTLVFGIANNGKRGPCIVLPTFLLGCRVMALTPPCDADFYTFGRHIRLSEFRRTMVTRVV
jgi:hypothetical protein